MQLLFAHDVHDGQISDEEREVFWTLHSAKPAVRAHAERIVNGIHANLPLIDDKISSVVQNFRIERLTAVDRNILRCAVYELIHLPEIPPPVVMDEAIEISKKYGTEDSSKFVNGVLDKIARSLRDNLRSPISKLPS